MFVFINVGQYMKSLKQFINESVVDAVIVKTKKASLLIRLLILFIS